MAESIHDSQSIYKGLQRLKMDKMFSHVYMKHILSILISIFTLGYRGKTVDYARHSDHHRSAFSRFLNQGKWDHHKLENALKAAVVSLVYTRSWLLRMPVYVIVDDTIASKTKPSSKALHPIEAAYFHYSHLKRRQDYGHQAIAVMLSCGGLTLNYTVILYDKTQSKIDLACQIAQGLPRAPVKSFFLCDSWYTCKKVTDSFAKRGFYTVGALKTNRVIYPAAGKQQIAQFASGLSILNKAVHLVTVDGLEYYAYRYVGKLSKMGQVSIVICYPKNAFRNEKALRVFLSTDTTLSIQEILDAYVNRWMIEVYFRGCKTKLAFDQFQIRSSLGIQRFWLLTSLAHLIACTQPDSNGSFDLGYHILRTKIQEEQITYIYQCGVNSLPLAPLLELAA